MMKPGIERRSARVALVPLTLLASGCQARVCEETYSPAMKMLVGLPIPILITAGLALALMLWIDHILVRAKKLRIDALLAVAVACALPSVFIGLAAPWLVAAFWPPMVAAVLFLSLRNRSRDPNEESWMHCLSDPLRPSLATRAAVFVLALMLTLVALLGTAFSTVFVSDAGRVCHEREPGPR